jgi:hypothetical protein
LPDNVEEDKEDEVAIPTNLQKPHAFPHIEILSPFESVKQTFTKTNNVHTKLLELGLLKKSGVK